jgi:hypothetical protein
LASLNTVYYITRPQQHAPMVFCDNFEHPSETIALPDVLATRHAPLERCGHGMSVAPQGHCLTQGGINPAAQITDGDI